MGNNYTSSLGISGGGVQPTGDAVEANVLAGKTFSNASGVGKTGTMVNNGAVSETLAAGQSYTVPEGYHNGSGSVTSSGTTTRAFTVSGGSGATLGTNFKVGCYYIFGCHGQNANKPTAFTGADLIGTEMDDAGAGGGNFQIYLLKATATTIVADKSPLVTYFYGIEIE